MNAHRSLSLLAAVVVTAAQTLVFAADTHATTRNPARGGYENTLEVKSAPGHSWYAASQSGRTVGGAYEDTAA